MALSLEKETNDNEGSFYKKSSPEVWIQRTIRCKTEWEWLCKFYKIAIQNAMRPEITRQDFPKEEPEQNSPKPSVRSPTFFSANSANSEYPRPRTWSDGNIQYTPDQKSPIDALRQAKKIKGPKYVRVIQNGTEEKKYELSPYETPVWPQTVLIVYDESRYEHREIHSAKEIPANAQRIEIRETEIQQFAREITHPSTLTFKLIYHVLGRAGTGEWFSSEGADESIILALDRLVRITHHPRYELNFVFEAKFSKPRYYRIIKQPPKSSEDAAEETEEKICPTNEDLQVLEKEEVEEQKPEQDSRGRDDFSPPALTEDIQRHIEKFSGRGLVFDKIFKNQMLEHAILTREEENALAVRMRNGDLAARNELILMNFKLVVSILKRRFNIYQDHPDFWDLLAEGLMGIMRAAEKFEPERGYKFSTYATWWIRQIIERAIQDKYYKGPMRLPVHMVEAAYSLRKTVREFFSEHQRKPTFQELATLMEISEEKVKKIIRAETLQLPPKSTSSLHEGVEDEDSDSVMDVIIYHGGAIADEREILDKRLGEEQNIDFILNAIDRIPSVFREFGDAGKIRYILLRYFSTSTSLDDIGVEFGVTRERVRQWIESTLAALRKYIKPEQLGI